MVISSRLKSLSVFLLAINVTLLTSSASAFSYECKKILSHTNDWSNPTADRIIKDTKKPWEKHIRDMSNTNPGQWYVLSHSLNFRGLGTAELEVLIINDDVQVRVRNLKINQSRWAQTARTLLFTESSTDRLIRRVNERLMRAKTALRQYYPNLHPSFTFSQSTNIDIENAGQIGTEFMAGFNTRTELGMDSLIHFITNIQGLTRDAATPNAAEWYLPKRTNWSDDILYYPPLSLDSESERQTGAIYIEDIEEALPYGLNGATKNFLAENADNISIKHLHFQTDKMLIELSVFIRGEEKKLFFELTKEGIYVPRLNGWSSNPLFGLIRDNSNSGIRYRIEDIQVDPRIVNAPLNGSFLLIRLK